MERQKFSAMRRGLLINAALGLMSLGSAGVSGNARASAPQRNPDEWRGAGLVLRWNNTLLGFFPGRVNLWLFAREVALMHVAMHDAINSIHRNRYATYGGVVQAHPSASPEAAANAAAHYMCVKLHPDFEEYFDGVYADSLAALPDNHRKTRGIQVGEAAAEQLWLSRINDGATDPDPIYVFPTPGPGVWRPSPPAAPNTPPFVPQLRFADPFVMTSASQFLPPPPPAITSQTFQTDFDETKAVGAAGSTVRTQDQAEAALWWGVQPGMIVANRLGRQLAVNFDMDFYEAARFFALINIMFADLTMSNIDSKETYQFWRPYTAIRVDYGIPGLGIDPNWTPFLPTPGNQEYPAAHPQGGGATACLFEHFFGTGTLQSPIGHASSNGVLRTFTSFAAIERDVIMARIAGGMHFRNSGNVGALFGRKIAQWTVDNALLPICD